MDVCGRTFRSMKPTEAVNALIKARWTEVRIAERVGTTQGNINRIKGGREPKYDLGLAIVALARRVVAQEARKVKV